MRLSLVFFFFFLLLLLLLLLLPLQGPGPLRARNLRTTER
jgi:hypothetical protein